MFLDESHVMIGQLGGMYNGDRARKATLVEYGFRLPSALDNRPLKFEEFETQDAPGDLRLGDAGATTRRTHAGQVVEQLVRPTGLIDPEVEVRPAHAPGRRRAAGDPRARRESTSACWSRR